jgi:hypothetical protein
MVAEPTNATTTLHVTAKVWQLEKKLAEERHRNGTSITLTKLRTYKGMKFSEKNNKNISTFMKYYDAKAKLTVEGFKEWTKPQAISYLMKAVEECTLKVTLAGMAILGGRATVKYVKVLNYLKAAFMDLVKSEKTLNKLTRITQCSNINIYIQEFNTLCGQTSLTITIPEATILQYFIQDLKITICMVVVAIHPVTLVTVQTLAREMDMMTTRHGNNVKAESMDTFVRSWDNRSKETCNWYGYQTITKRTTDKKPWKSQGRKESPLRPAMVMGRG